MSKLSVLIRIKQGDEDKLERVTAIAEYCFTTMKEIQLDLTIEDYESYYCEFFFEHLDDARKFRELIAGELKT